MRKITEEAAWALRNGIPFTKSNTTVACEGEWWVLRLHGNAIAKRSGWTLLLSDAGWQTTTTKERLNGVLRVMERPESIVQKDFHWHMWIPFHPEHRWNDWDRLTQDKNCGPYGWVDLSVFPSTRLK